MQHFTETIVLRSTLQWMLVHGMHTSIGHPGGSLLQLDWARSSVFETIDRMHAKYILPGCSRYEDLACQHAQNLTVAAIRSSAGLTMMMAFGLLTALLVA
jgi:hypothetical protein